MGRYTHFRQIQSGLSATLAEYTKRDGGDGENAQRTPGVSEKVAAIFGKSVRRLSLLEYILAK